MLLSAAWAEAWLGRIPLATRSDIDLHTPPPSDDRVIPRKAVLGASALR